MSNAIIRHANGLALLAFILLVGAVGFLTWFVWFGAYSVYVVKEAYRSDAVPARSGVSSM